MTDYYDRAGNPITEDEWTAAYKDNPIRQTTVDGRQVSTIFTGTGADHIFETVVFDDRPSEDCPCCGQTIYRSNQEYRYRTELAATEHHHALVAALTANEPLPEPLEKST